MDIFTKLFLLRFIIYIVVGMIEAARNGDFETAKERFDEQVANGADPLVVLNSVDGRKRSAAHYAAQYDEPVVMEWLFMNGADLFTRDDSNKSPIEISVLVNAKMLKQKKSSKVLEFLKLRVLNPIEQMFYIEFAESTKSVSDTEQLETMNVAHLCQQFPFHNNLQAAHLFAMDGRIELLIYLREKRGIDLTEIHDDDHNTLLHFANNPEIVKYLIEDVKCNIDTQNTSDGYTPCHSLIERIANEEISEKSATSMLKIFIHHNANLGIKTHDSLGVTELAIELVGTGPVVNTCLLSSTALSGKTLDEYLQERGSEHDSDSSVSVASHDDKVIGEDGEESDDDDADELPTIHEN